MRGFRRLHLIPLLALLLIVPQIAHAAQPVTTGWEYRWGDSPVTSEGVPEWTQDENPGQWHSIAFPSNPPDRAGRSNVWFRVTLPAAELPHAVLYIYSIDIIAQVYLDGEQIYQYGAFDDQGRGRFEGWPWHEIKLPEGYGQKPIYFRVFSDYTDIGLWGEVAIMDHSELALYIIENSLESLIIACFSTLIGLLALVFSVLQSQKRTFASVALFTLSSSVMLVSGSQASLLFLDKPLFWEYLEAGSYYLLPVALAVLLADWLKSHRPKLIKLVWKVHLVYFVGALGLALTGAVDLSSTFPVFDALFLVSLSAMGIVVIRRFRQLSRGQQVLLLAYGVFCSLLIMDMAVAHSILPFSRVPVSWGILIFSVVMVLIALLHVARTQKALTQLNMSLEQQVEERTASAEALARREQARVRMLTFENEKSRVLSNVIAELQDCLGLSQAFSVLSLAMPELCSPLRGALYRRTADSHHERLVEWGFGGVRDSMPAELDIGSKPPKSLSADTVYFSLNLESATEGIVTEGIVVLEGDGILASGEIGFGSARFITILEHASQRIGITLSSIVLREELQKFSYEDALTGLKNRRYFDQLFEHECAVAQRSELPLSLLLIDIDYFKRFNDTHGHENGDRALQSVAQVLQRQFRESDVVCRYGGEEFVVIMPGAITEDARERAQHVCDAVRAAPIMFQGKDLGPLTVSVGVACWPDNSGRPAQLLGFADQALYQAKNDGRSRVEIYGNQIA
ncbi:MAG TPA: diguanylate cyclase [Marinobacter sp.]|nr:diguanylate cyclase [Marinobacter sp.]